MLIHCECAPIVALNKTGLTWMLSLTIFTGSYCPDVLQRIQVYLEKDNAGCCQATILFSYNNESSGF